MKPRSLFMIENMKNQTPFFPFPSWLPGAPLRTGLLHRPIGRCDQSGHCRRLRTPAVRTSPFLRPKRRGCLYSNPRFPSPLPWDARRRLGDTQWCPLGERFVGDTLCTWFLSVGVFLVFALPASNLDLRGYLKGYGIFFSIFRKTNLQDNHRT